MRFLPRQTPRLILEIDPAGLQARPESRGMGGWQA
jgi:hypothetical protein